MNAIVESQEPQLPAPVARRGISEAQWNTLDQLFPGARGQSKVMVWDYCLARRLDPLKKPCHIVPMRVKDQNGDYVWRDTIMPGIYEYRTTAMRTNEYMGHSEPLYGDMVDHLGRKVPEWCSMTVYRWNEPSKQRTEFPVKVWFEECCATKWDKDQKKDLLNDRWNRAPRQMLTKCTEAAALREAFPDELGGTHTADEMEGQIQTEGADVTSRPRIDPRGDLSNVDWELRDKWVADIKDCLDQDKEESDIANEIQEMAAKLNEFPELYITVLDELARRDIITKKNWRKMTAALPSGRHGPTSGDFPSVFDER